MFTEFANPKDGLFVPTWGPQYRVTKEFCDRFGLVMSDQCQGFNRQGVHVLYRRGYVTLRKRKYGYCDWKNPLDLNHRERKFRFIVLHQPNQMGAEEKFFVIPRSVLEEHALLYPQFRERVNLATDPIYQRPENALFFEPAYRKTEQQFRTWLDKLDEKDQGQKADALL